MLEVRDAMAEVLDRMSLADMVARADAVGPESMLP
jgi:DNA-binding IscR family transcriptional regulator